MFVQRYTDGASVIFHFQKICCFALTIKGQNIGKLMSYFDMLDINKWKYMSFRSFKNYAFTSNAINCRVVVYQN